MTCETQIGVELAELLAETWRSTSFRRPAFSSEKLHRLTPLLIAGGGAALVWFSIRRQKSELSQSVLTLFHEAYIGSVVRAAAHEHELERVLSAIQTCGIRSILLKGWSVGRLYPESGLRPSGDIDLWIDPEQRRAAEVIVRDLALTQALDLDHDQLHRFENRGFSEFYASCETARLGSSPVNILQREDQLRILCLHFLKHGGWRPIWLCDIAVLLEPENGRFDWKLCLGTNVKRARWIGCTIALAHELLDARIPQGAPLDVISEPPKWFTRAVLQEWSDPRPPSAAALRVLLPSMWRRPWKLKAVTRGRWRNPIQATVDCDGAFNATPRWVHQARDVGSRTIGFVRNSINARCVGAGSTKPSDETSQPSPGAVSSRRNLASISGD